MSAKLSGAHCILSASGAQNFLLSAERTKANINSKNASLEKIEIVFSKTNK